MPPATNCVGYVSYYERELAPRCRTKVIDAQLRIFHHPREHYQKITANLLPILSMLTSGDLGRSLSPDPLDPDDRRPIMNLDKIVRGRRVFYVALDSLPDPAVGGALGAILLADLAALAGIRYNLDAPHPRISLFVDEIGDVINQPLIQILNKGAESGIYTTCAMQTLADLADRLGSEDAARKAVGNLNNLIALRSKDRPTQDFIVETFGKTPIHSVEVSIGTHARRAWAGFLRQRSRGACARRAKRPSPRTSWASSPTCSISRWCPADGCSRAGYRSSWRGRSRPAPPRAARHERVARLALALAATARLHACTCPPPIRPRASWSRCAWSTSATSAFWGADQARGILGAPWRSTGGATNSRRPRLPPRRRVPRHRGQRRARAAMAEVVQRLFHNALCAGSRRPGPARHLPRRRCWRNGCPGWRALCCSPAVDGYLVRIIRSQEFLEHSPTRFALCVIGATRSRSRSCCCCWSSRLRIDPLRCLARAARARRAERAGHQPFPPVSGRRALAAPTRRDAPAPARRMPGPPQQAQKIRRAAHQHDPESRRPVGAVGERDAGPGFGERQEHGQRDAPAQARGQALRGRRGRPPSARTPAARPRPAPPRQPRWPRSPGTASMTRRSETPLAAASSGARVGEQQRPRDERERAQAHQRSTRTGPRRSAGRRPAHCRTGSPSPGSRGWCRGTGTTRRGRARARG